MVLSGWRGLGLFWGLVLGVTAVAAAMLAMLGSPVTPVVRTTRMVPAAPAAVKATAGVGIAAPDAALLETAPDFPDHAWPRTAADGRISAQVYAGATGAAGAGARVALVVGGMGLDHAQSMAAIEVLPAAVDFAFSAYGTYPDRLLQADRAAGHEMLLAVPMEPAAGQGDEGERQLSAGADEGHNDRNLEWALCRLAGYAGVMEESFGPAAGRFAASAPLMAPVARTLAERGLFYLDPQAGEAPPPGRTRSVDVAIAGASGGEPTADEIDGQLAALARLARARGSAIGLVARPTPVAVGRIAAWSKGLGGQSVRLVPTGSLIGGPVVQMQQAGAAP